MSPELPAGTIAFLFTDIEGSTRLVARVGDAAYGALLAEERELVLEAATRAGGVPFGSEGDAHFVAFASAGAAIRGAVAAQRALLGHAWPEDAPVSVRMGVHAGEARIVDGDYVGYEVHRAARVAAAAHGGQVLVSGPAAALAGGGAEADGAFGLRDLGEHPLKDVTSPERLFQVLAAGLRDAFPPPRTAGPVGGNLPLQLTSFVGRAEVDKARALLDQSRLLTLTGPGGTGKTRLSLEIASGCADRYPDGAWFVPLAAVTDPQLVPSSIAGALGLLSASQAPLDRVRDHLRDRRTMLVLDNLEQILEAAPIVTDLLRSAPGLTVVASSRAPLRVAGEQEFPVPPLGLPAPGSRDEVAVRGSEAGRLFEARAAAVRPGFAITAENAGDVAEIVRRLDGLPLAIELAAARIRLLPPAAMARRLGDRLDLLSAGGRDLPERQRTLRGAIAWSWDLLDGPQRRLFARLAAFAGGGPLELVEEVCVLPDDVTDAADATGAAGGDATDVIADLEHLAEQSLVRIEDDPHGDVRFTMLETIREFAAERLAERGETDRLGERHGRAILALVDRLGSLGADRGEALDRFDDEHDNLRAAIDRAIETGDTDLAAGLAFGSWRYWHQRGHVVEGRRRVDRILAMPSWTGEPSRARLRALEAAGGLAYWAGSMTAAGTHYEAAVEEARRLGDESELANALYNHWFTRRPTENVTDWGALLAADDKHLLDEALEIWTRLGDEHGVARALWGLGEHYAYRDDPGPAVEVLTRALEIFERLDDGFWIAWTRFTRAFALALDGQVAVGMHDVAGALRHFRAARDWSGLCLTMSAMASMLPEIGRLEDSYAMAAAAGRATAETGLHLATLFPTAALKVPDPDGASGELGLAVERGRAWTREQALDEAIRIADEVAGA